MPAPVQHPVPRYFGFILASICAIFLAALATPVFGLRYHLSHPNQLGPDHYAWKINTRGAICVNRETVSPWFTHGSVWMADSLLELPERWAANGISDSGVVGGAFDMDNGYFEGFFWTPEQSILLGEEDAEGGGSRVLGMSPDGVGVGNIFGPYGALGAIVTGPGAWELRLANTPLGHDVFILDRGRRGDMVGTVLSNATLGYHPALWPLGGTSHVLLPRPEPLFSASADAVNDSGVAAGGGWKNVSPGVTTYTPCAWKNGALVGFGGSGWAYDVNNKGLIVGYRDHADGAHATLWYPSGENSYFELDLNDLIDSTTILVPDPTYVGYPSSMIGARLLEAYGINDCGVIVGSSTHGPFVLAPIDSTDTDRDGLWDLWETCGVDANLDGWADVELKDAKPNHLDMFVEIDRMAGAPLVSTNAIAMVRNAFAAVDTASLPYPGNLDNLPGINLHVELSDDDIAPHTFSGDPDAASQELALLKDYYLGSPLPAHEAGNAQHARNARKLSHRYCVWGNEMGGRANGFGDVSGTNFAVTLGNCYWNNTCGGGSIPVPPPQPSDEVQAGTFMHELGHTLGLRHGGDSDILFKPNYYSVMNYYWTTPRQWPGAEGSASGWRLRFSDRSFPPIDENALDETSSLGGDPEHSDAIASVRTNAMNTQIPIFAVPLAGANWIDYDGDSLVTGTLVVGNPNALLILVGDSLFYSPSGELLTGYDDWGNVRLRFRESAGWADKLLRGKEPASACNYTPAMDSSLNVLHERFVSVERGFNSGPAGQVVELGRPVPNPASGDVRLRLRLHQAAAVEIRVLDVRGRLVRRFDRREFETGEWSILWDGRDAAGRRVSSGVYFVLADVQGRSLVRRLVMIRE
jgi:hypothetical protein